MQICVCRRRRRRAGGWASGMLRVLEVLFKPPRLHRLKKFKGYQSNKRQTPAPRPVSEVVLQSIAGTLVRNVRSEKASHGKKQSEQQLKSKLSLDLSQMIANSVSKFPIRQCRYVELIQSMYLTSSLLIDINKTLIVGFILRVDDTVIIRKTQ